MIYLNLPLQVYIYILNISFILLIGIGYYLKKKKLSSYFKVITFWLLLMISFNFYNMRLTLVNYLKNSKKVGPKGISGDIGPRGYTGNSDVCTSCLPEHKYYGGNRNGNNKLIENDLITPGFCKLPFSFNNELHKAPIKSTEKGGPIINGVPLNDDGEDGWCATELNDDLTMKKYGYAYNSDKNMSELEQTKKTAIEEKQYIQKNSGILDLELITGVRSSVQCPKGFTKLTTDLNSNTDGNYVYLCNKYGIDDIGVIDVKIIPGTDTCPSNYTKLKVGLNEGVPKLATVDKLKLCVAKGNLNNNQIIKDISIVNDQTKCINGKYIKSNLNTGTNGDTLYLCTTTDAIDIIVDAAFVWFEDNNLYFFKNEHYWKFTPKKKLTGPFLINDFWGKIIGTSENSVSSLNTTTSSSGLTNSPSITEGIDAIYSDFFDKLTYIFKGNMVYAYDPQKEKIKDGFPKKINDIWKGLPKNMEFIDSVYADDKNQTIYFIKNKLYYKLTKSNKTFEKAKRISNLWINGPKNIIIKAMFNFNQKRYIIESDMVYEINDDNTFNTKGAKLLNKVFKTLQL